VHVQHHLDAATSEVALASLGVDAELSLKQLRLCDDDDLENAALDSMRKAGNHCIFSPGQGEDARPQSLMQPNPGMILTCLGVVALSGVLVIGEETLERMPLRESQLTVPETPSPDATLTRKGVHDEMFLSIRRRQHPKPSHSPHGPNHVPCRCAGSHAEAHADARCSPHGGSVQAELRRGVRAGGQALQPHQRSGRVAARPNDAQGASCRGTWAQTQQHRLRNCCLFRAGGKSGACQKATVRMLSLPALDVTLLTLQVALLEPLAAQLGLELSISVFACTDDKFMGLFTGVHDLNTCSLSNARLLTFS